MGDRVSDRAVSRVVQCGTLMRGNGDGVLGPAGGHSVKQRFAEEWVYPPHGDTVCSAVRGDEQAPGGQVREPLRSCRVAGEEDGGLLGHVVAVGDAQQHPLDGRRECGEDLVEEIVEQRLRRLSQLVARRAAGWRVAEGAFIAGPARNASQ